MIIASGKKCLEIGRLLDSSGWKTMTQDEQRAFCKEHLLHQLGIREGLTDLPGRYIAASKNPVLWANVDKLPPGIARIRELGRFASRLQECFDHNWITPSSKREQLDELHTKLFGKAHKPRH